MENYKILVVDDEPSMCEFLTIMLKKHGYAYDDADSGEKAMDKMKDNHFDMIICDLMMKGMSGIELLKKIKKDYPDIIFIIMTAFGTIDTAVEAMRLGVYDYITKPFKVDEILNKMSKALEKKRIDKENLILKRQLKESFESVEFIGHSKAVKKVFHIVNRVAETDSTILITGESGTGKELVAREIHAKSRRAKKIFLTVNCSALPENLLESELFGHMRGSFTGAIKDTDGKFYTAQKGTIFLDEIGDITLNMQMKLLRVLQNKEITPVGSSKTIKVDVRIISATNADLTKLIQLGKFREELYYRLNVININMPPLRERKEDIDLLVNHFLKKNCQRLNTNVEIDSETRKFLIDFDWPGNIRELENIIERMTSLKSSEVVSMKDIPQRMLEKEKITLVKDDDFLMPSMEIIERSYIFWVLSQCNGKKQKAAEVLAIDVSTLYRKIEKYGLEKK